MLTWKSVRVSKISVIYIYIDIYNNNNNNNNNNSLYELKTI